MAARQSLNLEINRAEARWMLVVHMSNLGMESAFTFNNQFNSIVIFSLSSVAQVCVDQQHTREEEGGKQLLGGDHQQDAWQ